MERIWQFDVGRTTKRPLAVDEHISRVTVLADSYAEATFLAVQMAYHPGVEMVTSTTYVE